MAPAATLDHDQCYRALQSRDARFDGRFWVGVHTTGIYCRPVCPSRTPLARNVGFFAHPAAAEDAGFRPCLRCRPDVAPGSPDWGADAGVVDRALRLIDQGALDEGSVDDLAARLAVGARHLRRLFVERIGTGPDAVARSRRAHLARQLLADTDLPVATVAFAAGFGSVRQCNDVVRSTFGCTPTELRARTGRVAEPARGAGELHLRLPARPPFDAPAILGWLAARTIPGVEAVDRDGDGTVVAYRRRVVPAPGVDPIEVVLRAEATGVVLTLPGPPTTSLRAIVDGARRVFDLDADPVSIDEHLGADPRLAPLVRSRPGMRVPGAWSGFEAAVRAVIGQQISVPAAHTVLGRIASGHGRGAFPTPADLVDAPLEELGIIGRRAATIREVAARILDGRLELDAGAPAPDLEVQLREVPGIGPWTASYVALRTGAPDAFPIGDLHLRRMLGPDADEVTTERWRPWRATVAMHLWHATEPLPAVR